MLRLTIYAPVLWLAPFRLLSLSQATIALSPPDLATPDPYLDHLPRTCPLPRCKRCPTVEQIQAPGVGFALEMGYGYDSSSLVLSLATNCITTVLWP